MNRQQIKFFVILIGSYLILKTFVEFWIGLCAPGGLYWEFADKYLNFIQWYREFLIAGAELISNSLGYRTISNSTTMRIIGKGGIVIVYSCIGYGIMSALTAIGIAMPSKSVKQKLSFIGVGILIFSILNMLRLFLISFYMKEARNLSIEHHDLFNIICYGILFGVVYWWAKGSRNK